MKEIVEFRVSERFASLLFSPNEGRKAGLVRIVKVDITDPKYVEIGRLQKELRVKYGEPFFFGWNIERQPDASEWQNAKIFKLDVKRVFEPAGEECGTEYDDNAACSACGSGAEQIGLLHMTRAKIPKIVDIAETVASEMIISVNLCNLLIKHKIEGVRFQKIISSSKQGGCIDNWMQLFVTNNAAKIDSLSVFGSGPFGIDADRGNCVIKNDLIGLNVISSVYLKEATIPSDHVFCSNQFYGVRRGLLRPRRLIFVRPNFVNLVTKEKLRGFKFEIAYLI